MKKAFKKVIGLLLSVAMILTCIGVCDTNTVYAETNITDGDESWDNTNGDKKVELGVNNYPYIDVLVTRGISDVDTSNLKKDVLKALSDQGIPTEYINIITQDTNASLATAQFSWSGYSAITGRWGSGGNENNAGRPLDNKRAGTLYPSVNYYSNGQASSSNMKFIGNWVDDGFMLVTAPILAEDAKYTVYNQTISFNYNLSYGDSITGAGILVDGNRNGNYIEGYVISFNNTGHNHKGGNKWCSRALVSLANGNGLWNSSTSVCGRSGKPDKTGAIFKVKYYIGGMTYSSNSNGLTISSRKSGVNTAGQIHGDYTLVKSFTLPTSGRMKVDTTNNDITVYVSTDKTVGSSAEEDERLEKSRSYAIYAQTKADQTGNLFGYFSEHYQHGCTSLGEFNLKNIVINKKARIDYSTVLNTSGIFNPTSLHAVINVDDQSSDSFTNKEKLMNVISASNGTDGKDIHFIQWGRDANKDEIDNFLKLLSPDEKRGEFIDNRNYQDCVDKTAAYIRDLFLQHCNENTVVKEQKAELTVTPPEMRYNSKEGTGKYSYGKWTVKHYSKNYTGDVQVNKQLYSKQLIDKDILGDTIVNHVEKTSAYATVAETHNIVNTKYKTIDVNSDDDPTNDVITGTHIKGDGTVPGEEKDFDFWFRSDSPSTLGRLERVGTAFVMRSTGMDSYNSSFSILNDGTSYKICRAYKVDEGNVVHKGVNLGWGFNLEDRGYFDSYFEGNISTLNTSYQVIDSDGEQHGTDTTYKYYILSNEWDNAPLKAGKFNVIDGVTQSENSFAVYKEVPIYVCLDYTCYPIYKDTIVNEYEPVYQEVSYEVVEPVLLNYDNNLDMTHFDDEVGLYEIFYEDELIKTVYEHRKPKAAFDAKVGALNTDTGMKPLTLTNKSYDLDKYDQVRTPEGEYMPGIKSCVWTWMSEDEMKWHTGKLTEIDSDQTYVVRLTVEDAHGEVVSTTKTVGGLTTPPVADFVINGEAIVFDEKGQKTVSMYREINIDHGCYDPNGFDITNHYWTVTYKKNSNSLDEIVCADEDSYNPPLTFSKGAGIYTYKLRVKNSKGKMSEYHMESIIVNGDVIAPDIEVNPLWCNWADKCDINVKVTDSDSGFDYYIYAFSESPATPADNTYEDGVGFSGDWSDKIYGENTTVTVKDDGKWYLHIKAYDKAGNERIYKTKAGDPAGLYLIDTTKPTITNVKIEPHTTYASILITDHDYSEKYKKDGSGVAAWTVTQSKTVEPVSWNTSRDAVKVYKSGVYYVWVRDLKGNVSLPYEIKVSKYILDYKYNYKGNNTSFNISDEIFYMDKFTTAGVPKRTLYEFIGWNSSVLGTAIDIPANKQYTMNYSFLTNELNSNGLIGDTTTPTIKLYAHWKRPLTLTFNMNGGSYKGKTDNIVLKSTIYNDQPDYTFNIVGGKTAGNFPYYDAQEGELDCYADFDSNGINSAFTKESEDGTTYRLLGWSTNSNAKEPDTNMSVYDGFRKTKYTITNNTVLYAVWEPVLTVNASLNRTLGNLTFNDGSTVVYDAKAIRADSGTQYITSIIKPGEQGNYTLTMTGADTIDTYVIFDTAITDIYTHGTDAAWYDTLNPSTDEDLVTGQGHGLNRAITNSDKYTRRKFYMPQYIGTDVSYVTSQGKTEYSVLIEVVQDSYYWKKVHGSKEQVEVAGTIFITLTRPSDVVDPINPPKPIISVLDELRTKLKIRLHS